MSSGSLTSATVPLPCIALEALKRRAELEGRPLEELVVEILIEGSAPMIPGPGPRYTWSSVRGT